MKPAPSLNGNQSWENPLGLEATGISGFIDERYLPMSISDRFRKARRFELSPGISIGFTPRRRTHIVATPGHPPHL